MDLELDLGVENNPLASKIIQRWDELKSERTQDEQDWNDLAELLRPQRTGFLTASPTLATRHKALASDPIMAANNFSAGLYGTLISPTNKWFDLKSADPEFAKWGPMKRWQDMASDIVLRSFRPSVSNFYSSGIQLFTDISVFGNSAQYEEMQIGKQRILDVTLSMAEICYVIDAHGEVIEVLRKFDITGTSAADMFGYDNLPEKMRDKADKGGLEKFPFYMQVKRNSSWQKGRIGPRGKRWSSVYVCEVGKAVVRRKGYDEMPFSAARYEVDTGRTYGTGPGYIALPSARVHHQMKAANLRAGQKAADPTLLAPDKDAWALNGLARPGHTIYGGLDFQGRKMLQGLDNFGGTGLSLEMQAGELEAIREAFHWSLTNLVGRTGIGPIEALEMQEQRLRLQAPHLGRIQEEYLAPKIARRFAMMWKAGQIPPPPEGGDNVGLDVQYTSAAAMAQKAAEGVAAVRIINDLGPLAQLDQAKAQRAADRIDVDAYVETLVEARGGKSSLLIDREVADAAAAQRAQQQQQAQMMEMAQAGGGVLKDVAQASGALQQSGGPEGGTQ
ncbi:portal protein [Roseobacter sp. N2S]|uniref:portal protein n=1 Tax=Roseobacter sp. N2S TaxID=2663844 RepID=UPI0028604406|nr:portal protein [Roseobacter sp. N2S]MDR6266545.1 hypothetical protein [Roseobacter sp. N2S]